MRTLKTIRHDLPLYFENLFWHCGKCEFKTQIFDEAVYHFRVSHLQAFLKLNQLIDNSLKILQEKYQGRHEY